jgi:hypothetical protein
VNMVMNLRVPLNAGKFSSSYTTAASQEGFSSTSEMLLVLLGKLNQGGQIICNVDGRHYRNRRNFGSKTPWKATILKPRSKLD